MNQRRVGKGNGRAFYTFAPTLDIRENGQTLFDHGQVLRMYPTFSISITKTIAETLQNGYWAVDFTAKRLNFLARNHRRQVVDAILVPQMMLQRMHVRDDAINHFSSKQFDFFAVRQAIARCRRRRFTHEREDLPRNGSRCIYEASPQLATFPKPIITRVVPKPEKDAQRQTHERKWNRGQICVKESNFGIDHRHHDRQYRRDG